MNARHITCAAIWALCVGAPAFAGFNEGDSIGPSGLELLVVAAFGVVAAPLGFLLTFFGAERVYKVLMWLLVLCLVRLLRLLRWLLVSLSPSACESGYAMRAHNLNRLTD